MTRHGHGDIVFNLPNVRSLRIISRSLLLTVVILSIPWIRNASRSDTDTDTDTFSLPLLVRDLKRQGLLGSEATAVLLGYPQSRLFFFSSGRAAVENRSVDFLLVADGFSESAFGFADRVLKVGGVVAVRLGMGSGRQFRLPRNYRMAYIRRFGSTVVAVKKVAPTTSRTKLQDPLVPSVAIR